MTNSVIRVFSVLAITLMAFGAPGAHAQDKSAAGASAAPAEMTAEQRAAFEKVIREYLLKNPEIVVEAIQLFRNQMEQAQQAQAREALAANMNSLTNDPANPVAGNPKGDVTIVEFFDYRCGFCKRALPTMQAILKSDPNIKLVLMEFPILGPNSVFASRAALAAHAIDPKKYMPLHTALMSKAGQLPEKTVMQIVEENGYDAKEVRKVMERPEIEARIQKNHALAERLNIRGTPAFVIGDQLVPGAVSEEEIRQFIAKARKG